MADDWRYKYKHAKQAELLKEFEGWTDKDFIDHILELREAITALEAGGNTKAPADSSAVTANDKVFKQEWSYPTKIHFLLHQQQKPLTAGDLHELLLKADSHYKDYDSPANNLKVSLARMVKSGRIKRVKQPGVRKHYYALPEWMGNEGELKEEFKAHIKQFL